MSLPFALPVSSPEVSWCPWLGAAPVTEAWAMGPEGKVPLLAIDLTAGFDGVFITVPTARVASFRHRLQDSVDTQRVVMGPGRVIVAAWTGQSSWVFAVLETAHANVGLTALEEVAVREGLLPDAYIIGVSQEQIQRLASEEVQQRVLRSA